MFCFVPLIKSLIIAFLLLLTQVTGEEQLKSFTCEISDEFWPKNKLTCTLKGLNLTSDVKNFHLDPKTTAVTDIKGFGIENSKLEVLTSYVCETLPFLTTFNVKGVGLVAVDVNALDKCTKLEKVFLSFNSLTDLPTGIFDSNENLLSVYLSDNKFTTVDDQLFKNNKNLDDVYLHRNRLRSLPPRLFENNPKVTLVSLGDNQLNDLSFVEEMPVLKNLAVLNLENNQIFDMDAEKLLEKVPNLMFIDLSGTNYFLCKRQKEIEEFFETKNVTQFYFGECIDDEDAWKTKKSLIHTEEH